MRRRTLSALLVPLAVCLLAASAAAQVPGWQWSDNPRMPQAPTTLGTNHGVISLTVNSATNSAVLALTRAIGTKPWRHTLRAPVADAGTLAHTRDRVFVAHYSARTSGAVLRAFDLRNGRQLWQHNLRALGPVHHSQYLNELWLKPQRGNVVVFGRESGGRYIEIRDGASGRMVAHQRVANQLASLSWNWQGHPRRRRWYTGPVQHSDRQGVRYEFTNDRKRGRHVRAMNRAGRPLWTRSLPGGGFCGNASLTHHKRTLYVVDFCSMSTGATLHAFDMRTGRPRWHKTLIGIGPVGHSKYFNDAQIEVRRGMIVVYGNEASGKYVEARDPTDGRLLVSRSFR